MRHPALPQRLVSTPLLFALMAAFAAVPACDKKDDDDDTDTTQDDDDDDTSGDSSGEGEGDIPEKYKGKKNLFEVSDADAVDAGETLYSANCASCHGADGKGIEALDSPSLISQTVQGYGDDRLLWIVSDGIAKTTMLGFKDKLDETEIWQTITFVRSLAK